MSTAQFVQTAPAACQSQAGLGSRRRKGDPDLLRGSGAAVEGHSGRCKSGKEW